ncbi:binding-protein-dependent transport systems inner membrane component [Beutenbergia cavernae DSM 12333]|uniref:Binding-protein-dependent transport systems inner membrane component n=1 Tax=Beutenbergia cavernae (strain ATCC BAA-8 / DSM 12333 / CCUG 43141 / JCM 11478 / NBRC 16432 / NCIMB 13614 / HKI 0122) TaxID=471853 RepID=C5C3P6_BEUC1|nr:sugar ABC transporter permease [Beutenbergia cavernae]ACQ81955.1 binding-protein-dependent transport systems inner membrane component [Beutenbergia cavernae DSM 12333]
MTELAVGRRAPTVRRPTAWPYALPAFVALAVLLLYPLGYNVWLSLHIDRLSPEDGTFVGLANYAEVLRQGALLGTLGRTLVFTLGSLVLQFVVGLAAALALERFPRGSRVLRPLLLAPWVIPAVAVGAIWLSILNPTNGMANAFLATVGIGPVEWLSDPVLAMGALIVANTWKSAAYWILMISAGLKTVPKEGVEAARVDGASYPRIVWHVLLPGIRPVLVTTALLAFIWTFNYFDLVYLLTNGGPDNATTTLPFAIWQSSLKFSRFDQAATYSVLSVLVTGIAIGAYFRVARREVR